MPTNRSEIIRQIESAERDFSAGQYEEKSRALERLEFLHGWLFTVDEERLAVGISCDLPDEEQ